MAAWTHRVHAWTRGTALIAALLALLAATGCISVAAERRDGAVVVILLDSAVSRDFIEGRTGGFRFADVSHGSLVGRVLRGYCSAPILAIPVGGLKTSVTRPRYLDGLQKVYE